MGERLFQMCWFSKFSLHAKPSSRLIDSWQMHSPTFIQKIRFVYLMHSFYFFHHCDMVQSFSSILFIITRMHLLPLVLLQIPPITLLIIMSCSHFLGAHVTHNLAYKISPTRVMTVCRLSKCRSLFFYHLCYNGSGELHVCFRKSFDLLF